MIFARRFEEAILCETFLNDSVVHYEYDPKTHAILYYDEVYVGDGTFHSATETSHIIERIEFFRDNAPDTLNELEMLLELRRGHKVGVSITQILGMRIERMLHHLEAKEMLEESVTSEQLQKALAL